MNKVVLPGSVGEEREAGAGGGGRWSEEDAAALAQVARWWRHRLARGDAADPLTSAFGGVDDRGRARTVGLVPAAVGFGRPLAALPPGARVSLWLHALGLPEEPVGEVYSLVGLGVVARDPVAGWLSRYATVGRAPTTATSLEARIALDLGTGAPAVQLVGVSGLTIAWTVEAYWLEGDR